MPSIDSTFKTPKVQSRAFKLHPLLVMIMGEMIAWAWTQRLPTVITETFTTLDEDLALKRTSSTHREGRAFDMSTAGWPKASIDQFIEIFSKKYSGLAALGASGQPVLILHHDSGFGDHFHVQIARAYSIFS